MPGGCISGQGHQPKMTLLWVLSSHDGLELPEDGAADVALEVPADLPGLISPVARLLAT